MEKTSNTFALCRIFLIIGILLLVLSNYFCLYSAYRSNEAYKIVLLKGEKIVEIKTLVDKITEELWGVVSLYDPQKSRKVKFSEGQHYMMLRKAQEDVHYAQEDTTNPNLEFQLDILQRTLSSLARNIDYLKEQLALQEFDVESTKQFFKDSTKVNTLKNSYIDEMQSQMEKIKTINEIVHKNVNAYVEEELKVISRLNEEMGQNYWKHLSSVGGAIFALFVVLVILSIMMP